MITCCLFLLTFSLLTTAELGPNCSAAPDPIVVKLCNQIKQWHKEAASNVMPKDLKNGLFSGTAPASSGGFAKAVGMPGQAPMAQAFAGPGMTAQCDDLTCLCRNSGGRANGDICWRNGQSFSMMPALRKEYRMLTTGERQRFHDALNRVKSDGTYNVLVGDHVAFRSPAAHGGPAFLPWHREFLKRLEMELRSVDSSVALPYWDSTLDSPLPEARDSVLWTSNFFGETDNTGHVNIGPFQGWRPTDDDWQGIRRSIGFQGRLFTEDDLTRIRSARDFTDLSDCFNFGNIEYTHGMIHQWVGGHMGPLNLSPNDPAFFLHHSFVDYIWESWRRNQNRWQRENDFPSFSRCSTLQGPNQRMSPYQKNNVDGLSNQYTDQLYNFEPRPLCSFNNQNCRSPFLFCDTQHGSARCVSKVQMGGRCDGFENQSICFNGFCVNGRCSSDRNVDHPGTTPRPITTTGEPCYNRHQCCDAWASMDQCRTSTDYMNDVCPASCRQCQTTFGITGECEDFFDTCQQWRNENQCIQSTNWMGENCRRTCGWCNLRRPCAVRGTTTTSTRMPIIRTTLPPQNSDNNCYNEHRCCQLWADQNECRNNQGYMISQCSPACGLCRTNFTETGECVNFHRSCPYWARIGECRRNRDWMNENCRQSCNVCNLHTAQSIRDRCTLARNRGTG